jgi:hypothetical protein
MRWTILECELSKVDYGPFGCSPGAGESDAAVAVQGLIGKWLKREKRASIALVVAHSNGYGDHVSGDNGFAGMPDTTLIPATVEAVQQAFGIGILLTGDNLYPGRLYLSDFPQYLASTQRLVKFTETRPVAHILGCHIEQSSTPFVDLSHRHYLPAASAQRFPRESLGPRLKNNLPYKGG